MTARVDAAPAMRRPSRIRPYGMTRGRTTTDEHLGVERLVATVGFDALLLFGMLPETAAIYEACRTQRTIAELAAGLSLPLAVVRVLIGDLARKGRIRVLPKAVASGTLPDPQLLQRVINGLANL